MKIYFDNNIKNLQNLKNLEQYKDSFINIHYIYSTDGIYIYDDLKKKIYNTDVIDSGSNYLYFNNKIITVNNSFIKKTNECYKFPFNYIDFKIKKTIFKLRKNALLKLVIEFNNNNVDIWYFETNESIENIMIKDDINTFLSLFL